MAQMETRDWETPQNARRDWNSRSRRYLAFIAQDSTYPTERSHEYVSSPASDDSHLFLPINGRSPYVPYPQKMLEPHRPMPGRERQNNNGLKGKVLRCYLTKVRSPTNMDTTDEESCARQQSKSKSEEEDTQYWISPEQALRSMTAAQARRRFAPSWAFVAWEMNREWFSRCMDYYFSVGRWPESSKLPMWLRVTCRDGRMSLQELYVQEPFAPMYMFLLRDMDYDWFNWAIDHFFESGSWPDFSIFPEPLHAACDKYGIGPDTYYSYL